MKRVLSFALVFGTVVREARTQAGWPLLGLVERCERIDYKGSLSKKELGREGWTLVSLRDVARAFEVPLTRLILAAEIVAGAARALDPDLVFVEDPKRIPRYDEQWVEADEIRPAVYEALALLGLNDHFARLRQRYESEAGQARQLELEIPDVRPEHLSTAQMELLGEVQDQGKALVFRSMPDKETKKTTPSKFVPSPFSATLPPAPEDS